MRIFSFFMIICLLLISGCNFALGTPSDSSIQTAIAQTMAAAPSSTPTEIPPITSIPTAQLTPSQTTTSIPLPSATTVISPPVSDQIDASVYALSNLEDEQLLITIQLPGNAEGNYRVTVNDLSYHCIVLTQYSDRLYCNGPSPGGGKYALLKLYKEGNDQPVFEEQIGTPVLPPPTAIHTQKPKPETTENPAPTEAPPTIPPYPYP
jgi:hypothetical protein